VPLPEHKGLKLFLGLLTALHVHLRISHLELTILKVTSRNNFLCHFPAVSHIREGNKYERATTERHREFTAGNRQENPTGD
jgi:hypothetical protein